MTSSTRATGFVARTFTLAVLVATVAGCGGGGTGTPGGGPLPTGSTLTAQPDLPSTGLVAEEATMPHTSPAGSQTLQALGALADGGHAVAWLATSAQGAVLHVQHFGADGRRAGDGTSIPLQPSLAPRALTLLPDGGVVLAFIGVASVSPEQPWITRTSVVVRRYGADGRLQAPDLEVAAMAQDRIDPSAMRYLDAPALAHWNDGSFVLAWTLVEEDAGGKRPRFWAQRFGAGGQPLGAPQQIASAELDTGHRVIATTDGGWILVTEHRVMGRGYLRYHARDGAVAPALPVGAMGFAEGSLLVPLAGGRSLLASPVKTYGAWQLHGSDGQPIGGGGTLQRPPVAATALRDGGWVLFHEGASAGTVNALRFDAGGRPVGEALVLQAQAPLQGATLLGGGVAVGWNVTGADGEPDVMTQRLR